MCFFFFFRVQPVQNDEYLCVFLCIRLRKHETVEIFTLMFVCICAFVLSGYFISCVAYTLQKNFNELFKTDILKMHTSMYFSRTVKISNLIY